MSLGQGDAHRALVDAFGRRALSYDPVQRARFGQLARLLEDLGNALVAGVGAEHERQIDAAIAEWITRTAPRMGMPGPRGPQMLGSLGLLPGPHPGPPLHC